jgi:serine/threonine-protein kinase
MPHAHWVGMANFVEPLRAALRGRYSIERKLGEGGMAVVFLAQDERHDRSVALKVLRPDLAHEIGAERFLREIKIAARLTHPHILPLYDSGEADGFLFYVMPAMEGRSLRERVDKERQLPLDDAVRITQEVASALDYAHRHGVIHRDIKPENILLHEGAAMVADFGIGKAVSAAERNITQTGMAIGTPAYMSPEQASAESEVDGRSDLYSLGCVLYEMLSGEPPYTGPTAQAVIAKRFGAPVPHVKVVRDIADPVDAVVTRALARAPVDRFASAAEFAAALRDAQSGTLHTPEAVLAVGQAANDAKSVAVLPFANMSADPENEYFSDGMTEEIINVLGKVPGIQVASRTSSFAFKGRDVDVRQIGEKLGVGTVLEGSVRKVGQRIRITTQLTDVTNGYNLWSETYDRQLEDVFAIQDEISRAIADALKVKLVGDTGTRMALAPENLEAYNLYLKGRFFYNKFTEVDLRRGIELFELALKEAPKYARAHAGIADCWAYLADDWVAPDEAYPKAKASAMRALDLEPSLGDALTALGKVLCWYEWDFVGAERELTSAVNLNPNSAEARFVFGSALPCVGKLDRGLEELRQALVLDPLAPLFSRWVGRYLLFSGDYDGTIEQSQKTLELDPNYFHAFLDIGSAYLGKGAPEHALEWYRKGQSLPSSVRSYDAHLVRALAAMGQQEEAQAILERLEQEAQEHYLRSEVLAMGYAAVGDFDRAFASLEQALRSRSSGLIFVHLDPGYEPLRTDARFAGIVEQVGVK